jgi:uncharacterized membrane protein
VCNVSISLSMAKAVYVSVVSDHLRRIMLLVKYAMSSVKILTMITVNYLNRALGGVAYGE